MKLLHLLVMLALTAAALLVSTSAYLSAATASPLTPASWTPPGALGTDLNGTMVHLSSGEGGITLYSPDFTPASTSWPVPTQRYRYGSARPAHRRWWDSTPRPYVPYRNRGYPTPGPSVPYRNRGYPTPRPYVPYRNRGYPTPRPYVPYRNRGYPTPGPSVPYRNRGYPTPTPPVPYRSWWDSTPRPYTSYWNWEYTTAQPYTPRPPTSRGVSVCLRVLGVGVGFSVFTLSPSTSPLTLRVYDRQRYALAYSLNPQHNLVLPANLRLWSDMKPEIWTRLCVTVDALKKVAQIFSGPDMSMRRMLRVRFVWSGEPVIDIPGSDGQVTDVQVWDYPLSYKGVFNYMTGGALGWHPGNVLTWSNISYSVRGATLLEDVYERQAKQRISSRGGKGRRPKGEKRREKDEKRVKGSVKDG